METKIFSFRLPLEWLAHLDNVARKYGFASRGEMLRLVIIEAVYNSLSGKLKVKKGRMTPLTNVLTCRLPLSTHQAITVCCKQLRDTPSIWGSLVIVKWWQDLEKEDSKQRRDNMYSFWLKSYAKNYRNKVSVYNTELP